jgi:hypothetical protein
LAMTCLASGKPQQMAVVKYSLCPLYSPWLM